MAAPMSEKSKGKDAAPLQPYALIPSRVGPINVLSPWFFVLSTLIVSASIVYSNFSGNSSQSWLFDLTDGMPKRGELGLGKFVIFGVTFPFEYPFRLAHRTIPSAVTPWLCYIPHQLGQFYLIFQAKAAKARGEIDWTDSNSWNPYAWAMFQWNVFFVFLHYLQTRYFYDGLSATFPELSTLFAGVSSLIVVYVLEFRRRGLIFTWTPAGWKDAILEFSNLFRKYHGYLASFGITLTFWYHTMESTLAHWTGFIHIFLLMWQSSLMFQNIHRNRYWKVLLEMWILLHGSVVAYYQGILDGGLYLMFFTSFTLLFLMGPLWGLPIIEQFLEPEKGVKPRWRFYTVLGVSMGLYIPWWLYMYHSKNLLHLAPMCLALPTLYYFFIGWYYLFYASGKRIDVYLTGTLGWEKKSRAWWVVISAWGSMSLLSIMAISEIIYRQFVPYSRG